MSRVNDGPQKGLPSVGVAISIDRDLYDWLEGQSGPNKPFRGHDARH